MRLLSHFLFAALAAAAFAVCVWTCVGVFQLVGKPFIGFSIVAEGFVNPVGLRSWGGERAGFKLWDRIVAVDGELVWSRDSVTEKAYEKPVGTPVVYQVEGRDGSQRFVVMPTQVFSGAELIRSHVSQAFLGLAFVIIAVLLYFLRPGTPEAWTFFFFFSLVGVCLVSVVDVTMMSRLPAFYTMFGAFMGPMGVILVGVITRSFTTTEGSRLFEGRLERGEPGFTAGLQLRPQRRMYALCGASLAIAAVLVRALWTSQGDMSRFLFWDSAVYLWLALQMVVGLTILVLGYLRGKSPRRRARIRQILWAWPVGAGIPIVNLFVGNVLQGAAMSLIWNAFIMLVPLSTADAIVRHDMLRLNRTARRLVGGLTVAAVMGMALGLVMWAAANFLKLDDAAGMVALAALLFAVAAPVTHRVQVHVESLLRSSKYDAGQLLAKFTARASTANHLRDVLSQLRETSNASLAPSFLELYRYDRGHGRLVPQVRLGPSIDVDAAIAGLLEQADPVVIDDEQPAPRALPGAALALRLAVANEPVGLLVLGTRADEKTYEGGDVAFVASLAGPLAAALVNTLAFEAVEQLNQELEGRVAERTRELEAKNRELATLNQRKDELVATISHDFRSPLAIIRQNVQTILRDMTRMDRADLRTFLEGVARQEDRLTALCTNLLDLARLKQRGTSEEDVRVDALLHSILEGFKLKAQSVGVELGSRIDDDAPVIVNGDRDRLGQVLQNLVDNALKFTEQGGRVLVHLSKAPGGQLLIEVEDTGCGVPADALPRVFEPFFQVPRQTHVGQGSGLGLAIVKAVIEAHRGTITVDSIEGQGTTFHVLLAAKARPVEPRAGKAADQPDGDVAAAPDKAAG